MVRRFLMHLYSIYHVPLVTRGALPSPRLSLFSSLISFSTVYRERAIARNQGVREHRERERERERLASRWSLFVAFNFVDHEARCAHRFVRDR